MKSSALLPSNLPSVIDRSNLSPRRECTAFHFYFLIQPQNRGGGFQNQQEHHIILTKYEAVHPTALSETNVDGLNILQIHYTHFPPNAVVLSFVYQVMVHVTPDPRRPDGVR